MRKKAAHLGWTDDAAIKTGKSVRKRRNTCRYAPQHLWCRFRRWRTGRHEARYVTRSNWRAFSIEFSETTRSIGSGPAAVLIAPRPRLREPIRAALTLRVGRSTCTVYLT